MGRKVSKISMFVIIGGVGVIIFFGYKEPKIIISAESFKAQCLWSISVPKEEIVSVDTVSLSEIPRTSYRSNGISLFGVHRGWFKTKDGNTVGLSMRSGVTPVIRVAEKMVKCIT